MKATQGEKDTLWKLDADARRLADLVKERTGAAWREMVEGGNWQGELTEACNTARELLNILFKALDA